MVPLGWRFQVVGLLQGGILQGPDSLLLGEEVHDPEVYDALVRQRLLELKNAGEVDTNYFPAYRLGLE